MSQLPKEMRPAECVVLLRTATSRERHQVYSYSYLPCYGVSLIPDVSLARSQSRQRRNRQRTECKEEATMMSANSHNRFPPWRYARGGARDRPRHAGVSPEKRCRQPRGNREFGCSSWISRALTSPHVDGISLVAANDAPSEISVDVQPGAVRAGDVSSREIHELQAELRGSRAAVGTLLWANAGVARPMAKAATSVTPRRPSRLWLFADMIVAFPCFLAPTITRPADLSTATRTPG